ncbi:hypothetical protein COY28_02455 [Candidatus Woesearchaeota archaeon CG_4_10_14_0_2_um_filter_57_5]|nr:MAG: hypothetical protein COY28_02455 [Candidatus Woesearchaeota archaeon CG_4_10_14_0_2_um_filter_57_5]
MPFFLAVFAFACFLADFAIFFAGAFLDAAFLAGFAFLAGVFFLVDLFWEAFFIDFFFATAAMGATLMSATGLDAVLTGCMAGFDRDAGGMGGAFKSAMLKRFWILAAIWRFIYHLKTIITAISTTTYHNALIIPGSMPSPLY